MILNLNAPPVDNETDDILVKSANGDMGITSKAALIAEAGGNQNLQQVLEQGSEGIVDADISINRTTGGGNVEVTLTGTVAKIRTPKRGFVADDSEDGGHLYAEIDGKKFTIPEKESDDTFAMLSDIGGGAGTLQEVTDNGSITTNPIVISVDGITGAAYGVTGITFNSESYQYPETGGTFAMVEDIDGRFIPLSGTTEGNPVAGDIQMQNFGGLGIYGNDVEEGETNGRVNSISIQASSVDISNIDPTAVDQSRTTLSIGRDAVIINDFDSSLNPRRGLQGGADFTSNITDLDYTQKKYVDDAIAAIPSGATNLTYTASPTNGTVNSDTGTDATIPLGDNTNAGLIVNGGNAKLANVPSDTNSALALKANDSAVVHLTGNETIAGNKTFSGNIMMAAGTSIRNASSTNIFNFGVGGSSTPVTLSNNVATAVTTFVVDNQNASNTGQILELQSGGVTVAKIAKTGDIEVMTATAGIILKSPNGTRYRVTVSDAGVLTTTAI